MEIPHRWWEHGASEVPKAAWDIRICNGFLDYGLWPPLSLFAVMVLNYFERALSLYSMRFYLVLSILEDINNTVGYGTMSLNDTKSYFYWNISGHSTWYSNVPTNNIYGFCQINPNMKILVHMRSTASIMMESSLLLRPLQNSLATKLVISAFYLYLLIMLTLPLACLFQLRSS